ncbi:MAG: hypothetical protein K8T91_10520 [Planctomycetes bacterium]|nr:hypothetical protein [Planctomycetota bacterium]
MNDLLARYKLLGHRSSSPHLVPGGLEEAQLVHSFEKAGTTVDRIPYGNEDDDWGASRGELCHDCEAAAGQYHALGCDVERCPLCGEQALCCDHDWYNALDTDQIVH